MGLRAMRSLFEPSAVAVLGIGEGAADPGRRVVENLAASGFKGAVYPVRPGGGEVG
ncbi:hypothetical protein G3N55_12145, partial [Dissulfurirhabdus thermomarina]|nr:hypothetical protein [Dissulfurirhabdus thermomarina]